MFMIQAPRHFATFGFFRPRLWLSAPDPGSLLAGLSGVPMQWVPCHKSYSGQIISWEVVSPPLRWNNYLEQLCLPLCPRLTPYSETFLGKEYLLTFLKLLVLHVLRKFSEDLPHNPIWR